MKVLQLNNSDAVVGGSDRVYHETCALLRTHGHEVISVACGEVAPDAACIRTGSSYVLSRNAYRGRSLLEAARNAVAFVHRSDSAELVGRIIREHRPDVAHLHIFYGQLTSSILGILKSERIPTVMTVHEYRMLCPVSTLYEPKGGVCERCAGGRYWHAVLRRCNRGRYVDSALSAIECAFRDWRYPYQALIDHFLMVSDFCRQKHLEWWPQLESRSSTLYNFVDASERGLATRCRSSRYILYAGRLAREKGVATLLAAVSSRPGIALRVAGTGPLKAQLEVQFAHAPNVTFLGHLERDALRREISGARYCVVPSEWYENNPMSVLESFAAGVPVIGARIGGIPEMVANGVDGFLFEPSSVVALGECLEAAWRVDDAQYEHMRCAALAKVRAKHSPEVHLNALLRVYSRVMRRA